MKLSKGGKIAIFIVSIPLLVLLIVIVYVTIDEINYSSSIEEVDTWCNRGNKLVGSDYWDWYYSDKGEQCVNAKANSKYYDIDIVQYRIDKCQYEAFKNYNSRWVSYCEVNDIEISITEDGEETCKIPSEQADRYDEILQKDKELCITRYK